MDTLWYTHDMETRVLKMLSDRSNTMTDEAYNSFEEETRAALIALLIRPECRLAFSKEASEENCPTEDKCLYLGSHECGDRKVSDCDDAYIELWAWSDEDGNDFATWNIATTDSAMKYPIYFCPFCGTDLAQWLTELYVDTSND